MNYSYTFNDVNKDEREADLQVHGLINSVHISVPRLDNVLGTRCLHIYTYGMSCQSDT